MVFSLMMLTIMLSAVTIAAAVVFLTKVSSIATRLSRPAEAGRLWQYTDEEFIDDITAFISAITIIILGYCLAAIWHFI